MRRARTWGWARMRRYDDPYNDLGPSSPHQSCPDCIIATRGYDFREGQDVELIQAATAVAAFAFLPFGQLNRSNIVVDTFTQRLPERVRTAIDAFWDIIYAAAAVILSWRLSVAAFDAIRSHTVSTVIGLPIGWFILAGVA